MVLILTKIDMYIAVLLQMSNVPRRTNLMFYCFNNTVMSSTITKKLNIAIFSCNSQNTESL